jgi:hypothetical protein
MIKTPIIRSIIQLAVGLLLVGTIGAFIFVDQDAALGVLCAGLVMMGSFVFGGWTAARLGQMATYGVSAGAALLVVLKLPVLGLSLWMLFKHFDPLPVVAGGSVVVLSIFLATLLQPSTLAEKEA